MTDKIQFPVGPQPIQPGGSKGQAQRIQPLDKNSFAETLDRVLSTPKIKFSAHAAKRLQTRGIELNPTRLAQLSEAIDRVEAKGGRESLVLMDQMALIVSVKNRTVITAIDGDSLRTNVFTNIDSAIIT